MDAQGRIDKLIKENNNHPLMLSQEQIEFVFKEAVTEIDTCKFNIFAMKNLEGIGTIILSPKEENKCIRVCHNYKYDKENNILEIKEK